MCNLSAATRGRRIIHTSRRRERAIFDGHWGTHRINFEFLDNRFLSFRNKRWQVDDGPLLQRPRVPRSMPARVPPSALPKQRSLPPPAPVAVPAVQGELPAHSFVVTQLRRTRTRIRTELRTCLREHDGSGTYTCSSRCYVCSSRLAW